MAPGETGSVVGALGGGEVLFVDGVSLCSGAVTDPGEVDTAAGTVPAGEEGSRLCSETQRYSECVLIDLITQIYTSLK